MLFEKYIVLFVFYYIYSILFIFMSILTSISMLMLIKFKIEFICINNIVNINIIRII